MDRLTPVESLRPHPVLSRLFPDHDDEERERLRASIEEHGFKDPITAVGSLVVDGHQRLSVAKELGVTFVPVIHLTERSTPEMIRLGAQLNAAGRTWSNEQKRETTRRWLFEFPEWSNRRLAECLPCSRELVRAVRADMEAEGELAESASREARDGSTRPATKAVELAESASSDDSTDSSGAHEADPATHDGRQREQVPPHDSPGEPEAAGATRGGDTPTSSPEPNDVTHDGTRPLVEAFGPDEPTDDDLLDALEECHERSGKLEEELDLLREDDLGAELSALHQRYARLENRLQQALRTGSEEQERADYLSRLVGQVRDELGVDENAAILPAIRRLA